MTRIIQSTPLLLLRIAALFTSPPAFGEASDGCNPAADAAASESRRVKYRTVEIDGQPLHLTGKEYGILELLSLRKGTTLTKEMFLNHLYGGMDEPELKIIDVFVCKLRKKLSSATGGENYIETVWGRGHVLRDPAPREHEETDLEPQAAPA